MTQHRGRTAEPALLDHATHAPTDGGAGHLDQHLPGREIGNGDLDHGEVSPATPQRDPGGRVGLEFEVRGVHDQNVPGSTALSKPGSRRSPAVHADFGDCSRAAEPTAAPLHPSCAPTASSLDAAVGRARACRGIWVDGGGAAGDVA